MLAPPLFSQETILLKGKVVADSLNESAINIINFTQKTGTTNNASGYFEILVSKSDTLIFSSVQYNLVEVAITHELFQNQFLQVQLFEKVNELAEVEISNINLSGNLGQDLKNMKVFSQAEIGVPFSSRPVPTLIQRKMANAKGSALELLINTLNGRIEMLKKAEELMKFDDLVEKAIEAVPTEFFIDNLRIPQDEIINFVTFCTEGSDFREILYNKNHLSLIESYYLKAPEFLAQRKK